MKRHILISLVVLGVGVQTAFSALPPSWKKPISLHLTNGATDVLVAVPLDAEVYRNLFGNYASLRVLNSRGNDVSFHLRLEPDTRTQTIERSWPANSLELDVTDEQFTVEIALENKAPRPTKIEIRTPLKNFEQRVRVIGLGKDNERVLADDVIFDYSQYMDVRRTIVTLPETSFRKFRLVIEDPTSEQESQLMQLTRELRGGEEKLRSEHFAIERRPFRIDQLWLIANEEKQIPARPLVREWDIEVTQTSEDEEAGQTLIEFESGRQLLSEITLRTSDRNFSRQVRLETPVVRSGKVEWREIQEGRVFDFQFGEFDSTNLKLKFPQSQQGVHRLVVENRDSTPLKIEDLKAAGPRHQIVFLAEEGEEYELHYNSQGQSSPDYDIAAIEMMLTEGVVPEAAELGPEIELSVAPLDRYWNVKHVINNSFVLFGLIGVLVVLLGWSLYRASKKLNEVEE